MALRSLMVASWVGFGAACGPTHQKPPPYHVVSIEVNAPPLPGLCGDTPACATSETWVVFYSTYCGACHELLRDLSEHSDQLGELGICVITYLVDVDGCPSAMRISGKFGGWPVGLGENRTFVQWKVDTAPILYMIKDGNVRTRVQGRASFEDLLRVRGMRHVSWDGRSPLSI